ncbi:MAG: carboxypeptidase regulatory-like domain-containing protein [Acidobacteriota bacterium]|nr:carboxypeptidase regulatory-like domain-containing protein [Acidobacteriota bacterium]
MKTSYTSKVAGILCAIVIVAFAIMFLGQKKVTAAAEGKITGTVKLDGQAPHQKPIDMSKEPSCAAIHKDKPVTTESVTAGANGGLANVVVYISEGLTGNEAVAAPSTPVEINQKGCQYLPHVVALDAGQHMKVVNSDQTSHNIHPQPTKNPEWNKSQPPGSAPFDVTWANPEIAVPVKCNIHPWMRGWVAVVKGPYGVSDESGAFSLSNVPPGNYTVTAWQETYGTQTQKVTVAAGKPASVTFTFKAK